MTKLHGVSPVSNETISQRIFWTTLVALVVVALALLAGAAYGQQRDPRCDIRDECTFSSRPHPRAAATVVMPEQTARSHDARCDVRDECSSVPQLSREIAGKDGGKTKFTGEPANKPAN